MIIKRISNNNVIEYEYNGKKKNYDTIIQLKISKEMKEKLNKIALKNNTNNSNFIRNLIENEINKEE